MGRFQEFRGDHGDDFLLRLEILNSKNNSYLIGR